MFHVKHPLTNLLNRTSFFVEFERMRDNKFFVPFDPAIKDR